MIAATKSESTGSIQARCVNAIDDAADDDCGAPERVAEYVKERGSDVEIALAALAQHQSDRAVDREADRRDERHQSGRRLDRRRKTARRFVHDRNGRHEQNRAVDERAEHFDAPVTEGAPRIGGPRRADRRDEREREREDVHADVHGVRRQRQALRSESAPELEQRDQSAGDQREGQPPAHRHRADYERRARIASAASIAPKNANVLLSRGQQRLRVPFSLAVAHRLDLRNDARNAFAIPIECFAELRTQKALLVRDDRRIDGRHRGQRPADEREPLRGRVFSGKCDRETGRREEVADIERIAYVRVRSAR